MTAPPTPTAASRDLAAPATPTAVPARTAAPTVSTSTPVPSAPLVQAAIGPLSRSLHPYPDSGSYTQQWLDVAALLWGGADGSGALLAFDWDALDFKPALATALPSVSGDNRTFKFTLRDGLKWSDGTPITADHFQFAWEQASRDDNRYVQLELVQDIAAFRTLDPRTVEMTLREARPRELALASLNVVTPMPRHVWEGRAWTDAAVNPEIRNPSVVLGPFRVEDYRAAERASFVAVDTYAGGRARVPRVTVLASADPGAAFEHVTSGRANWLRALPPTLYEQARAHQTLVLKEWMPTNAAYRTIEFNLSRPFLSDRRVRQALARAINRTELITTAEAGLGVAQYGFIQPSNQRWLNTSLERYDFDLGQARALLETAGYALRDGRLVGKDAQPVKLQVVYPSSSVARSKMAVYLQQQYRQLGITVEALGLDFTAYTDAVQVRRAFDVSLAAYGGGSIDPDFGPRMQLITNGPQNVTGYSNQQVDEIFRQARVTLDAGRRKQLYDQAQALVNADPPSHYLYALKSVDVFGRSVKGVMPRKSDRLDTNDTLLSWTVDS